MTKVVKSEFKNDTIADIIKKQLDIPQINTLNRLENAQFKQIVAIMLVDLNDAFSDKIGFKESHIDDILDILPIRFPFFRLNDIYQVCFGLKTSKYGVFGRLDVPTFLEACKKYEVEKQEHQHEFLMNLHMRKKDVYNGTKDIKNDFKEKQNEAMSKYLVDKFKTKG